MKPEVKRGIALLLALALLISQGGCTYALWSDESMGGLRQPALEPDLHLYESGQAEDFLVVYNESYRHKHQTAVHRRAYWLGKNLSRTADNCRPIFANSVLTTNLLSIPVYYAQVDVDSNQVYSAICATNSQSFSLFSHGKYMGAYDLPVYTDRRGNLEKAALTPFAVTIDLTVIGGIFFLWGASESECDNNVAAPTRVPNNAHWSRQ